jgi:hypothetical protein
MVIDSRLVKLVKIYVYGSLGLFTIIAILASWYTVSKALDSKRLVDSQIEYQEALTKSVGQPQTIIQRYETPNR